MEKILLLCLCLVILGVNCQVDKGDSGNASEEFEVAANKTDRKKKAFSFLQIMKFPNDVCAGSSRNGTCYTSDECTNKGGSASGSCANGFGVCCVFILGCGQTSSENNTFLVLTATTTPSPTLCTYTLCEANPNICRIRLDFTTFVINGPQTSTVILATATPPPTTLGGSVGDCISDTFSVIAPQNRGSPVICGTNTGQHIIVDTSSSGCVKANFEFGLTANSRSYDIKVTQYNCGDEMAGPNDCLQYFTGNTGTFTSFNFIATGTTVSDTSIHLSNQNYNICFRRNMGKCAICYTVTIPGGGSGTLPLGSFGLSFSPAIPPTVTPNANPTIAATITPTPLAARSALDTLCTSDYIVIPNGQAIATALAPTGNAPSRFCGRFLNLATASSSVTVCSGVRPFKISFVTDANEVDNPTDTIFDMNEFSIAPGGIIGFSLAFNQVSC